MKKMKIEKQLIFADHVAKVLALQVNEGLTYKHEEDGIRALGPLYVIGQYVGDDGVESYQETLEMDVFAPKEKLSSENFQLEVADYQAIAAEEGIQLSITLNIHGLKENSPSKAIEEPIVAQQLAMAPPPIVTPTQVQSVVEETSVSSIEEEQEKRIDDFNDLFADTESTYTSYRIVVAKEEDSYPSIAHRYDVDETSLRNTNKNKDIYAKTLVILPFMQK